MNQTAPTPSERTETSRQTRIAKGCKRVDVVLSAHATVEFLRIKEVENLTSNKETVEALIHLYRSTSES